MILHKHIEKCILPDMNEISDSFIEIEIPIKSHVKSHFNKVKFHHSVIRKQGWEDKPHAHLHANLKSINLC